MSESKRKLAVVSGASRGIGKAILHEAALKDMNLAFCSRTSASVQRTEEELKSAFPELRIVAMTCDVSVKAEIDYFSEAVLREFGAPHLLVNNAGVFRPGNVLDEDDGSLEEQLQTNLLSAYHLSRALIPSMINSGSGHVFNICSVASLKAYPGGGSYSISKFALLGLSKALREELKEHGIRVTSVLPGATYTDSWEGTELPEERFMPAGDIAKAIINTYELSERTVVEDIILRPLLGDI